MGPFSIDHHLIAVLERYAQMGEADEVLLASGQSECPLASLREVAQAALIPRDRFGSVALQPGSEGQREAGPITIMEEARL